MTRLMPPWRSSSNWAAAEFMKSDSSFLRLILSDRLALAMLLADADTLASTPDGEYLDVYKKRLAENITRRLDQLSDADLVSKLHKRFEIDSEFSSKLRAIHINPDYIRPLVTRAPYESLANQSLQVEPTSEIAPGGFYLAASTQFAIAVLYTRLSKTSEDESMKDWVSSSRSLYKKFQADKSGDTYKTAVQLVNEKNQEGPNFVLSQVTLAIVSRIIQERVFQPPEFVALLQTGELSFQEIAA